MSDEATTEDTAEGPGEIEKFWDLARFHARLNPAPSYFGPTTLEAVTPPAWSFGDTPEAESELARLLESGTASLSAPEADYGDELPQVGSLAIVLGPDGHPHALVETSDVSISAGTVTEEIRVVYSG